VLASENCLNGKKLLPLEGGASRKDDVQRVISVHRCFDFKCNLCVTTRELGTTAGSDENDYVDVWRKNSRLTCSELRERQE